MIINKELAKQCAIDMGLTEDEAEQELDDFISNNDDGIRYCEDCGTELDDSINCNDQFLDDYCDKCWNKGLKELEIIKKGQ